MHFNALMRKQIKRKSKLQVQQNVNKLFCANILVKLPSFLLFCILLVIISMPAIDIIQNFGQEYSTGAASAEQLLALLDEITAAMGQGLLDHLAICVAIIVLEFIITAPLHYGMQRLYIGISRDQATSISCIFEDFSSLSAFWRALKMNLCLLVRTICLWILPGAVCALIVYRLIRVGAAADAVSSLMSLLRLLSLFISVKLIIYNMGWIQGLDDASVGAWQASKNANQLMRGHFFDVLLFVFSFLLWTMAQSFFAYYALIGMASSMLLGGLMMACYLFFAVFLSSYQQVSYVGLRDLFVACGAASTSDASGDAAQQ